VVNPVMLVVGDDDVMVSSNFVFYHIEELYLGEQSWVDKVKYIVYVIQVGKATYLHPSLLEGTISKLMLRHECKP
jgi:hypothetical protein